MKNKEIWKDIEGYEGIYQISNFGDVKSLNYSRTKKEHTLKQQIDKYGYKRVLLYKNNKSKHYSTLIFVDCILIKDKRLK